MTINSSSAEIQQLEEALLDGMRLGKLSFLEKIFSEKYIFLGTDGATWGKDQALADYRNPNFELSSIEVPNRQITANDNSAIVIGISIVEGSIGEKSLAGRYLFMRVWSKEKDGWKIIAVTTHSAENVTGISNLGVKDKKYKY